jgi:hypothetical protein
MTKNNEIWALPRKFGSPTIGLLGFLTAGCIQGVPVTGQVQAQQVPVSVTSRALPISGRTRADKVDPQVYLEFDGDTNKLKVSLTDNPAMGMLDAGTNHDYAGSELASGLESFEIDVCGRKLPLVSTINVPLGTEELSLAVFYHPIAGRDVGICPVSVTARDNVGNSGKGEMDLYIFKNKTIDRGGSYSTLNFGNSSGYNLGASLTNGQLQIRGQVSSDAGIVSLVLNDGSTDVKSKTFQNHLENPSLVRLDGYTQTGRTGLYEVTALAADGQTKSMIVECNIPKKDYNAKDIATHDGSCTID